MPTHYRAGIRTLDIHTPKANGSVQLFNWERSPSPSARCRIQETRGVDDFDALFVVVTVDE